MITDVVTHRAGLCLGRHIVTPISKTDILDAVPAMRPVSQANERRGQLDLQPALPGMPADRLVTPILVRLTVSGDEPPGRLPTLTPLSAVDACGIKVVTSPGKATSASADRHAALSQTGFQLGEPVPERLQAALLLPAFPLCCIAVDAASALPGRHGEAAGDPGDP